MPFTPIQVYYLNRLNIIRENPGGYASSLGIDLNEGLAPGTISIDPKPPLRLETLLTSMADAHSQEMLDLDFYDHVSPTTGGTLDRYDNSAYNYIAYGENLGIVPSTGVLDQYYAANLMIEALFIDAGVVGRGHRTTMLNPSYRDFGVGHKIGEWSGFANTHILTMEFGLSSDSTTNVIGFVLEDQNSNGFFDTGEGISGIEVEAFNSENLSMGSVFSDTNGYYDFPLIAGTYTLKAYTPDHSVEQVVVLTTENQYMPLFWDSVETEAPIVSFSANKTDFIADLPYTSLLNPVNVDSSISTAPLVLTWAVEKANRVTIGKSNVDFSGTLTLEEFSALSFVLEAYGPAGYTKSTLNVAPRLFQKFNSVFS
jgi:hypothetical protein